ncbi:hypothetical protein CkaCkLH20_06043 [Colletotrichum karsti]|uniref:Uncharacterized protein n=1 Tax=Colletotrichum karsti TaxID=1095194 RepID=A0A9P6I688_9PEZI|nr:uncharacterized protein CkaCkLH20_06043 [Colletotrichum karsti]KAF9876635.1 hypothetical protein CkaCkLH20_06043 [Colletotrichum karsti]
MGGSVFTTGNQPLNTPRMPPEIYERVKAQCYAALRKIYICVASPIEGPAKKDYGDIDILVAWEKSVFPAGGQSTYAPFKDKKEACEAIQEALGSPFIKIEKMTDHYAVLWPGDDTPVEGQAGLDPASRRYVQIDITICESLERMQMKLFKHAHGDLWSILGTIIRPYGLTVDEEALWIRIVEIEKLNKNKAKVFLTNNSYEILSFLGLDASDDIWNSSFGSLDEMYEYVATCRFFSSTHRSNPSSPSSSAAPSSPMAPSTPLSLENSASPASVTPSTPARSLLPSTPSGSVPSTPAFQTPQSTKQLNSRDKKRMDTRPAYSNFVNEFVPRCQREGRYLERPGTIRSVREEVFQRFPGVREVFERRHNEFLAEKNRETIMAKLKNEWIPAADPADVKQCQRRGCQVKALKKIIFEGDDSYDGILPEEPLADRFGRLNESKVHKFVMKHKEVVGKIAFDRHQQAYAERMRQQELKEQQSNGSPAIDKKKTTEPGKGSNDKDEE